MEWQVIKFNGVLGIQKENAGLFSDYEVLEQCETEKEAYALMKVIANKLNLNTMRYNHLN